MSNTNTNPFSTNPSFQEKLNKLPLDVREAMFSIDTANILKAIAEENNLHVDQSGDLVDETGALMLGDTKPSEFIAHIQKRVRVDENTARKMAEKVNEEIFRPIRESLKEIHKLGDKKVMEHSTSQKKPSNSPVVEVSEEEEGNDEEKVEDANTSQVDPYREPIENDDL